LGVKWPCREADHSPPSIPMSKNEWSYTSTPNTPSWRGARLKHRDNFTFTFYLYSQDIHKPGSDLCGTKCTASLQHKLAVCDLQCSGRG
jgi:hypothetical protein